MSALRLLLSGLGSSLLGLLAFAVLCIDGEEEVILGVGHACDVDVGSAMVNMHDVVDDISATTVRCIVSIRCCGAHFSSCSSSCIRSTTCDVLFLAIATCLVVKHLLRHRMRRLELRVAL